MSRQGGGLRTGLQSGAQKSDSARDLLAEEKPRGNPVAGAFGSREEIIENNRVEPDPDRDKEHKGTHSRYE